MKFNDEVRLILSDVDETIAGVYEKARPEMIAELEKLLVERRVLFLVSGAGFKSIQERIIDLIQSEMRHRIVIAHCSGAEVWGFQKNGEVNAEPYYSLYEGHFSGAQKKRWREIIDELIALFHLITYGTRPRDEFIEDSRGDPLSIMLADRGPQITFECTNSTALSPEQVLHIEKETGITIPLTDDSYDLRIPIMEFANRLYAEAHLPLEARLGGVFALDHVIQDADKARAIKFILDHESILERLDIHRKDVDEARELEIWGDRYDQKRGGTDFAMCRAVSPNVRAIDFRDEDRGDLPAGYNIQLWDGKHRLHHGLLEYLQSRHSS